MSNVRMFLIKKGVLMKSMPIILLFFFLQSWTMHKASISESEGVEVQLSHGGHSILPSPFFELIKPVVFCKGKGNIISSKFTVSSIVLGYQMFILSLISCNKDDLFFPLLEGVPRGEFNVSTIFAYNKAAKKIFLQKQYLVMNRFKKLLYGDNEKSFFTELDLSQLMNHWMTFQNSLLDELPNDALHGANLAATADESGSWSMYASAAELLRGLVQSYCASFVRAQLDIQVARLLHKDFASNKPHTPSYVTACCSILAMQSEIFGSKKKILPAIELLANFVYDHFFTEYVKKNHEFKVLKQINPDKAFSIYNLLQQDTYALKRICPATHSSKMWWVRLAHIDLRDMGIRNLNGIYEAVQECAEKECAIAFFPFFLRPIELLPETIDFYRYAFAGINLAGNKMQDVWLPTNELSQFDRSADYLFTVRVEDNPLHQYDFTEFMPITELILDKKQKKIAETCSYVYNLISSHNSRALDFQRTFFKESYIGLNSEFELWLRKNQELSKQKALNNTPFIGPWPEPSVVYPVGDIENCSQPKKIMIHRRTKSL